MASFLDTLENLLHAGQQAATTVTSVANDPAGIVRSVTVDTEYFPQIFIARPLDSGGTESNSFMKFLKPKVTIKMGGGLSDIVIQPEEAPSIPSKWPLVFWSGIALLGLTGYFAFRGITCPRR